MIQGKIEPALEADWPWMMQGHLESVWESLSPSCREEVSQEAIKERLEQQIASIQGPGGFPNQAFVARGERGEPAGFVWVAEIRHEFTGQPEAFVLAVYVAEAYRGRGLGRRLMETAEEWARQRGLKRITLSVGVHNTSARRLYEGLGYRAETMRMSKEVSG